MEAGRRLILKNTKSKAGKKKKNGSSKLHNRKSTPRSQRYRDWPRKFYLTLPYYEYPQEFVAKIKSKRL